MSRAIRRTPPRATALAGLVLGALACQGVPSSAIDAGPSDAGPPDAAVDATPPDAGLPDLVVDLDRARADLAIQEKSFAVDSCELDADEDCVAEPGLRRLLHFSVETPNLGDGDMVLGRPQDDNDQFAYSSCHQHYHFEGYAEYRLLDASSKQVATGRKQAFCLLDSERYLDEDGVSTSRRYDCDFQGIQRGWSDVYHSRLPCQFVDVTDIADGAYTLEISLNNGGTLPELSMANNVVSIPVTLGGEDISSPTEVCPDDLSSHASDTQNRECGWVSEGTFACTPSETIHVGCAQNCGSGIGECTGDPMLRVCDADRSDGNCSYPAAIGSNDDAGCSGQCPIATGIECPDSGMIEVFSAPFRVGAAYTCDVEVVDGG